MNSVSHLSEAVNAPRYAILCKSYAYDLSRAANLAISLGKYNVDSMAVFFVVPGRELALFQRCLPSFVTCLPEEPFLLSQSRQRYPGWFEQQIIKMAFGLSDLADAYLVVDSDSEFIRDFTILECFGDGTTIPVMASESRCALTPYDDQTEQQLRERLDWALGNTTPRALDMAQLRWKTKEPELSLPQEEGRRLDLSDVIAKQALIQQAVGRVDATPVESGPAPLMWFSQVLRQLDSMLGQHKLNFTSLLLYSPWEMDWYMWFVLRFFPQVARPVTPLGFHIVTDELIALAKRRGVTRQTMAKNFMCVTLASRHQSTISF